MRRVSTTSSIETRTNSVVLYGRAWVTPLGKLGREPGHRRLHALRHLEGIGAGELEDADERRRLAAHAAEGPVALGAQLHAGDVANAEQRAVGPRAEDDVLELGRRREAPARGDGVLELLPGQRRRLADLSGRGLEVLLPHRVGHVAGGEPEAGESVGVQPEPHAVVPPVEHGHLPHAGHPRQHVHHLERGVVRQVELVAAPVGRGQGDDLDEVGTLLGDGDALPGHVRRGASPGRWTPGSARSRRRCRGRRRP